MPLRDVVEKFALNRFDRFNVVLAILLAGWVPSILMLWLSYTILSSTLESKIFRDRQAFVQLIGHLVGDDLGRTSGIIEYYQTSPEVKKIFTGPNPQLAGRQWLGAIFYAHPRIDGMFLAARDGRLIASLPSDPATVGKNFGAGSWLQQAAASSEAYVSPVHPRFSDKRMVTDIVGAVRGPDRNIVGYIGVSVLVERIGKRLSMVQFSDQMVCQILDQTGQALFSNDLKPTAASRLRTRSNLIKEIRQSPVGHLERHGDIISFSPIESTNWVALVEQPEAVAFKSVYEWRDKIAVLAMWLIALTAFFAWLSGRFYRRQTEAARRIEREVIFNEKILANMPIGIAFVDPSSRRFLQANEAFAQMARRFGDFSPHRDIMNATCDEVKIVPAEAIEKVLTSGTPFQLIEHPLKGRGETTHFVNIHLLRLQGSRQNIQGVLYLVEDKTRDVALRQELIKANAAKDQFLALLSHELRNPLTPVIAMVGELETNASGSSRVRQALEVIRRNVELEARLIDDLLDVTRIAKGKLQLTFETVSAHKILRRAYEICEEEIASKELEVKFRLDAKEAHIEGDPARLQQVFWNLIKNSVKFTPAKGCITITTENPTPGAIEIRVSDTGIGIDQEKIGNIFHAFEQGQSSITRRFGGLGLGLAISKAMVEAHHGEITAESPGKDKGTTFVVKLDTVPKPPSRRVGARGKGPAVAEVKQAERHPHRVLVVDDHADTCTGMKLMLERRGYKITVAHSADQAVEKADQEDFDLMISDIGLPDRSGYELMRELHQTKGLPGIALTGFGMENDVARARAAGFSGHLTKPINFEQLDQAIRDLLKT
jgi:signal transduction histidine kinase